jgi:hypothetical protein
MSDDIEARAREMGWRPLPENPDDPQDGEFRGDPDKFVPAEEFVDRGEKILPIVLSHKKQLEKDIAELRAANMQITQLFRNSTEAIEALKEAHEADVARAVEKERARLKAELRAARREDDDDRIEALEDELDNLPSTAGATNKGAQRKEEPQAVQLTSEFTAWMGANPWYGKDLRRTSLAEAIGVELRQNPANNALQGTAFWNKVAAEVEATLTAATSAGTSKVDTGSRGGTSHAPGDGKRVKGYGDLPAEAKKECDRQATKLVGEGRAFKTRKEHDEHYAAQYFRGE